MNFGTAYSLIEYEFTKQPMGWFILPTYYLQYKHIYNINDTFLLIFISASLSVTCSHFSLHNSTPLIKTCLVHYLI